MKIFIASSGKHIGKVEEDIYIRDTFRKNGIVSEISSLKEIVNISKSNDMVILKSIWGYHLDYMKFIDDISNLKKNGVRLINDYGFIFWNIDKSKYLDELHYINVIPTAPLQLEGIDTIVEIKDVILENSRKFGTDTLVIKPCISESGYLTFKYDTNKNNETITTILKNNKQLNFIAQPYRSSILEGELSVIIINGVSLYGIMRFPGILNDKLDPSYIKLANVPLAIQEEIVTLKNFFLRKFGRLPNICRVDFLKRNPSYEILEVELIDPDLFFRYIPESMKNKTAAMLYKSLANR